MGGGMAGILRLFLAFGGLLSKKCGALYWGQKHRDKAFARVVWGPTGGCGQHILGFGPFWLFLVILGILTRKPRIR